MPKGDYQRLKADVEDGVVQIAHLLLEALSMAKLNGVAKGLVLFIWRRTYGWSEEGSKKYKDDRITLAEFAQAVDSERTYVSTQLKTLVRANVIYELQDPDNGRYKRYGMNTDVAAWSTNVIDVDALAAAVHEKLYVHSSRKVSQTLNGLVITQPFANTKPLSESTTKPLCESTTVVSEKPLTGADSGASKESIERNKEITDDDRPPISPLDDMSATDFEDEVQWRMRERMGDRNYMLKTNDYQLLNSLLAEGVSRQCIVDGIELAFKRYKPKHAHDRGIRFFTYCQDIIYELYEIERSRTEAAATPVIIEVTASKTRAGPPNRLVSQGANGSTTHGKRDERYAAFYQLFPDA